MKMKRILLAVFLALPISTFAANPAVTDNPFGSSAPVAQDSKPIHHAKTHHATQHHQAANDLSYGGGYYTNVSGHHVHRPVHAQSRPSGATAHCRDGSWSFSEHRRGTCSRHGGVGSW